MTSYEEGRDAYHKGIRFDENPYAIKTDEFDEWADGWQDADEFDSEDG